VVPGVVQVDNCVGILLVCLGLRIVGAGVGLDKLSPGGGKSKEFLDSNDDIGIFWAPYTKGLDNPPHLL
jgi:hypothetical protein